MNTRRMHAKRVDEEMVNEGIPSRVEQVSQGVQVPQVEQVPILDQGNGVQVDPPDIYD